jgi:hypothetical protein
MVLSSIPDPNDPHPALAVLKVLGMTALMVGSGVAVFIVGQRKKAAAM